MNAKHSNKPTLGGSILGANAIKGNLNLMGAAPMAQKFAQGLGNLLQQQKKK